MKDPHIGMSLDDWLREEGIFEEAQATAIREVMIFRGMDPEGRRLVPTQPGVEPQVADQRKAEG